MSDTPEVTSLQDMTLSAEDRERFLRARGLTAEISEAEAQRIRAEWPDEDILMAIGSGMF